MRRVCLFLGLAVVWAAALVPGAGAQAAPAGGAMEVYHVHVAKAAPGKVEELTKSYLAPPAGEEAGTGHVLVLRHAEGDNWDLMVIEHLGATATVEPAPPGPGRELRAWHEDTFASGPPWAEFAKAMGIGQEGSDDDVFVASTYRGTPGHRSQLEQTLERLDASSPHPENGVLLRHLEGAAWDYLVISRSDSWQALAAEMSDPKAEERQRQAGLARGAGLELREHMAAHHDTIAERAAEE
jgi:hypothetical protein